MQIARSFVPGGLAGWIVWPKPEPLAALMAHGEAFVIPKRDHMRATGDKAFKAAGLAFLGRILPARSSL